MLLSKASKTFKQAAQALCGLKVFCPCLLASIIYSITLYCSLTASDLDGLLGKVSPSQAIFVLNVLSKLGDISFGFAVSSTWALIEWSFVRSKKAAGGLTLPAYFALDDSTGSLGLLKMVLTAAVGTGPRLWAVFR
jgi:hypothetical protein